MTKNIISTLFIFIVSTSMVLSQYSPVLVEIDSAALQITTLEHQNLLQKLNTEDNNIRNNTPRYKTTAFFCVMEEKLQKSSNVAVRFRVGSLNYVNTIEGKYYNQIDHITNTIKP